MDIYNDIKTSLLAFCKQIKTANSLTTFQVFDFDAHAVVDELPTDDLIGVAEYAILNSDRTYTTTCLIVVCTQADDEGTARLNTVIGKLFTALKPNTIFQAVSTEAGAQVGHLKVMDQVHALPMALTQGRPLKAIAVQLASSFLVPP